VRRSQRRFATAPSEAAIGNRLARERQSIAAPHGDTQTIHRMASGRLGARMSGGRAIGLAQNLLRVPHMSKVTNSRLPPTPTAERARSTAELMLQKGTDTPRWAQFESLATQWDKRAAMAAEWIDAGSRVLDVGAGAMALGSVLQPQCSYQPADVVERRPGCFVVDLNRGEFPPGEYDFVTFLGVLEYVHDVEATLRRAGAAAPRMVITYCTYTGGVDVAVRRGLGWVNELTAEQFRATLESCGWRVDREREVKRGPGNIQLMFLCARAK
jgi:hypothetical protein